MSLALPPGHEVGDGTEYLFDECPNCLKEEHFYYSLVKKVGECKVCGWWLKGLGALEREGSLRIEEGRARQCQLNGQTINAWFDDSSRAYLVKKGVTREQCLRLPILLEPTRDRISVPVDPLSPEWSPTTLIRYYAYSDSKWYSRPGETKMHYVFNGQVIGQRKRLLVMEGMFDVLAPRLDDYAVAILGTQFGRNPLFPSLILTALQGHELYVWFDWDEAGRSATEKLLHHCNIWGLTAHDLTTKMQIDPKLLTPNLGIHQRRVVDALKKELDK